jgi:hypothetical protein
VSGEYFIFKRIFAVPYVDLIAWGAVGRRNTDMNDVNGNPMFTWQNLMVFIICATFIYLALKFRIAMVFRGRPKGRKRHHPMNTTERFCPDCVHFGYRQQAANQDTVKRRQ